MRIRDHRPFQAGPVIRKKGRGPKKDESQEILSREGSKKRGDMRPDDFQDIIYQPEEETGIVTVTINQPARKNALSALTFLELWYAVDTMEKDPSAKAMILTGQGDIFSSGGYFDTGLLKNLDPETVKEIDLADIAQKKLCLKFWQFKKPVIAAINGLAIGGGFTFPFSCADFVYMAEEASISLPFLKLGILPEFASTYLLPRLLGFQKAKEIMYSGGPLSAQQALELGLVNKVLPREQLMSFARQKALEMISPQGAGLAMQLAKQAIHKPLIEELTAALDAENQGLGQAFASEDFKEVVKARQEKRKPVFKGK